MKILITGGHIAPALAVADELKKNHRIVFVGRRYISTGDRSSSLEYREVKKRKIPFYSITTGRFTRILSFKSFLNIVLIPVGLISALNILRRERPDAVLSFGGYIAVPICIMAYILGISVYTHEQTSVPGIANRLIARLAVKVFVAFEEAARYFDKTRVVVSGNPVRSEIFKVIRRPFVINKDRPVIYITGGSLGSHSINEKISELLPKLLDKYIIIHQAGDTRHYRDFDKLQDLRNSLSSDMKSRYFLVKHFQDTEIGYIYKISDLIVGRSGANTFFELIALEKPAILIPLPWSGQGEQQSQAEIFKKHGTGEVFSQFQDSRILYTLIDKVIANTAFYKSNFRSLKYLYKINAAATIIAEILKKINFI